MNTRSILTLRRRLTCLYTVTTSLILTLVLAVSLLARVRDTRQSQLEDFYDLWNSLQYRIQSDHSISQTYLAQTEAAHSSIIHIEENGTALLYAGSWSPRTNRQELIRRAKSLAEAENVFTTARPISAGSIASSLLTFQGDTGETYYSRVLVLPYGKSIRALCLISYIPPMTAVLHRTFLQLFLLELLGIVCLTAISWKFVGWSLRPVAESQQRQAEFIAAASHELRSPLAVIRAGLAALRTAKVELIDQNPGALSPQESKSETTPTSKAPTFSKTVPNSVAPSCPETAPDPEAPSCPETALVPILSSLDGECVRMSRLIDDMLLLASADAKTWQLERTRTDMDTLLIELYESYLPLCRQKQIELRLDLPEQPIPPLLVDGGRIRQVLAILLDNAMTYTPAGREIRIQAEMSSPQTAPALSPCRAAESSARTQSPNIPSLHGPSILTGNRKSPYLTLRITDQGPGIPDKDKARVFDRFYRADSARSDKSHYGLGLSIARELVHLHGGSIEVTDNKTGGSCFAIRLPASAVSA